MSIRRFWRRTRVFAGVALALALIGLCFWLFAINWRPAVKDFPIQGIDVAEAQGEIDWWAVKRTGIVFAYARATHGVAKVDHERRLLSDPEDDHSWIVYAAVPRGGDVGEVVATTRITWGGDGFSSRQIEQYQLAPFLAEIPADRISDLKIEPVERIEQVLKIAFQRDVKR